MARSISLCFSHLSDHRGDRGTRHLLSDIMTIAVLSMLCGGEDFTDMEDFGLARDEWLRTFLKLPAGIPSHDTFGRVFAALDPDSFEACFRSWTQAVAGEIAGVLAIDGKTLRRSFDKAGKRSPVHMVSAWASDNGVVLGQLATDAKSNEITAIPKLLKMLDIKGLIVTIDAMGCQKEIAKQIVAQQGEYVLSVKANQPALLADIKETFRWARSRGLEGLKHSESKQTEKGHGRLETRHITVLWQLSLVADAAAWAGLACIAELTSTRTIGEITSVEHRYAISNMDTRRSTELGRACRAHWGVENGLHWALDVSFDEDHSRARVGCAAENLSRLRRIALNMLKLETSGTKKRSIERNRFLAALDQDYLIKLLQTAPANPPPSQNPTEHRTTLR